MKPKKLHDVPSGAYDKVLGALFEGGAKKATLYISPSLIVRATRQHGKPRINDRTINVILTVGSPNYAERQKLKLFKKAEQPLPLRAPILTFDPVKKKAKKRSTH